MFERTPLHVASLSLTPTPPPAHRQGQPVCRMLPGAQQTTRNVREQEQADASRAKLGQRRKPVPHEESELSGVQAAVRGGTPCSWWDWSVLGAGWGRETL